MKAKRGGWRSVKLVVVLAQGVHDHGGEADATVNQHVAGCDDLGLHLAGNPSADLGHAPLDHCLACQFRADHHGVTLDPPAFDRPAESVAIAVAAVCTVFDPSRRNSCRARHAVEPPQISALP